MSINPTAMSESFYMSNMSPQEPGFNRGIWKKLEETVRGFVTGEGKLYVVTGPILSGSTKTIGPNQVTVPRSYYKVIYAPAQEKMIAFVMFNTKLSGSVSDYAVSVDHVEKLTGIDFYPGLPDSIEEELEAGFNVGLWNFNAPTYSKGGSQKEATNSVQCKGIASSTGQRCKNKATNPNGYCRYHQPKP